MPRMDSLLAGAPELVAPVEDSEKQAAHAAAPQVSVDNSAGTIVLALVGFMAIYYGLHIAERWAAKA